MGEASAEPVGNAQQVLDITGGVTPLRVREGTFRPVGEAIALGQLDAHDLLGEVQQRWCTESAEAGCDLRVEDASGESADCALQDRHVLIAGMHDHDGVGVEHGTQRRDVDGEWVDERESVRPGDLQ